GLHQHAVLAHVGAFCREVGIQDATLGHVGVVLHVRQVVVGVVQTVDGGAELGTQGAHGVQRSFDRSDGGVGGTGDLGTGGGGITCIVGSRHCNKSSGEGLDSIATGSSQIHFQGFAGAGTDLKGHGGGKLACAVVPAEQRLTGELGVVHDVGDFHAQLVVFGLDGGQVVVGVGAVGALGGQILHAL